MEAEKVYQLPLFHLLVKLNKNDFIKEGDLFNRDLRTMIR